MVKWAVNYEKHKDIIRKEIKSIDKDREGYALIIEYKNKVKHFLVMPKFDDIESLRIKLNKGENITLITVNSLSNIEFLIDKWKLLIDFPGFIIIFINPFSLVDDKWMIMPYAHNRITDQSALKKGLKSMFAAVDSITEEKFLEKVNKHKE